jgi:lantibiotic modifying enzyme
MELRKGQRYLFYYDNRLFTNRIVVTYIFRANFVNIVNNYLIVEKYSIGDKVHDGFWTMPFHWIVNIETLEDILTPILPRELMLEIDNFIL